MSYWTHITACIYLETDIKDNEIKSIIENKLKSAPKITGSEGDADIFVMPLSGHNVFVSCDCNNCQYKGSIIRYDDGSFSCEADDHYRCVSAEYQTSVCISIIGDLRDRMKEDTRKEYKEFIKWLNSNFDGIRLKSCTIRG